MDEVNNSMEQGTAATSSGKKRKLTQEERERATQEREAKRMAIQKEKDEKAEQKRLDRERIQRQKDEERERKRLEDEEVRRKKEEDKERKRLEDEEVRRKKEEEKERKRLEDEQIRKEKERKRLEDEEVRRKKEEEKERKRREDEERKLQKRRQEEEVEQKKKRQSETFKNFFQKIEKPEPPPTLPMPANSRFKPFEIKEGMTVAPIHRREKLAQEEYDSLLRTPVAEASDYLTNVVKKCVAFPNVDIIAVNRMKAKLFQFDKAYRPPYYGTWRKKSKAITGRRPFSQKESTINYEYDSDAEWEYEPSNGDECKSDEEDNEEDIADEDEENDGFMVEHGYLSNGEGSEDDENLPNEGVKETDEQRKHRLAHMAEEWKESLKQKQRHKGVKKLRLQPNIFGPSWQVPDKNELDSILQNLMFSGVVFNYASLNISQKIES